MCIASSLCAYLVFVADLLYVSWILVETERDEYICCLLFSLSYGDMTERFASLKTRVKGR